MDRYVRVVWSDGDEQGFMVPEDEDLDIAIAERYDGYPFGESNLYEPTHIEAIYDARTGEQLR